MIAVLKQAAPCIILLDEVVACARNLEGFLRRLRLVLAVGTLMSTEIASCCARYRASGLHCPYGRCEEGAWRLTVPPMLLRKLLRSNGASMLAALLTRVIGSG